MDGDDQVRGNLTSLEGETGEIEIDTNELTIDQIDEVHTTELVSGLDGLELGGKHEKEHKSVIDQVDLLKQYPLVFSDVENSKITYVEAWDLNLYIGTDQGELIHLYKLDDVSGYIQISKQTLGKSIKPIKKIVILSEISIVLVHYGSTVSGFLLPELSPANIGKAKDVVDVSIDWNDTDTGDKPKSLKVRTHLYNDEPFAKITLFTSKSIKYLKVFKDAMRLSGEIPIPGISKGLTIGKHVVWSNEKEYNLYDMSLNRITCTFSITNDSMNGMPPVIQFINKNELLMVGGGKDRDSSAIGMFINLSGDVVRGTITFDQYPQFVCYEYPYIISTSNNITTVFSILDQTKIYEYTTDDINQMQLFATTQVFELEDADLVKKVTRAPIVSIMDMDEIQRIASETDIAAETVRCYSSVISVDDSGKYMTILKPWSKVERLLTMFEDATEDTFLAVFDQIQMELVSDGENEFIIHLLGLFTIKWDLRSHALNIWIKYTKVLDPRFLIYCFQKENLFSKIYGSVWTFQVLFGVVEELRKETPSTEMVEEMLERYLRRCMTIEFEEENYNKHKSIEIALVELRISTGGVLNDILMDIKFAREEVVEELLINKKYYSLSKLYTHFGEHRQFLYYWRGLIEEEFIDEEFSKNFKKTNALNFIINYISQYCIQDDHIIEQYSEWLLKNYPVFGLKLIKDERFRDIKLNDIKILNILKDHPNGFKIEYLEYIFEERNEKQFMGDLIIEYMNALQHIYNTESIMKQNIDKAIADYLVMKAPKVSLFKYWKFIDQMVLKNEIVTNYHRNLYKYLSIVPLEMKSIFDQKVVIGWCKSIMISTELENVFPLITLVILERMGDPDGIVQKLIHFQDYRSAEKYAVNLSISVIDTEFCKHSSTVEPVRINGDTKGLKDQLLKQIFEIYLQNNENELIDEFLHKYDLLKSEIDEDTSVINRVDKFVEVINRIPESFPLVRLKRFATSNLIEMKDHDDDLMMKRSLIKLEVNKLMELKELLES